METVPALADQVTAVLVAPVTLAVNCFAPPERMVAEVGEMLTEIVGVVEPKNSAIDGAVAPAPGKLFRPSASKLSRSVLWCW